MAVLTDKTKLNDGTEIVFDTTNKTIQLIATGNLTTDGVTLKTVYDALKDFWKTSSTYIKYPFPMQPITDEQFEIGIVGSVQCNWTWKDSTTRNLLKTAGWAEYYNGTKIAEYAGVVTLGSLGGTDQVYYSLGGGAATDFVNLGPVNQAIQTYSDPTNSNFDYRTSLKIYVRIYQKTYGFAQLSDIGVTTMTYQVYRFPLSDSSDAIKITHVDGTVSGYGITITWYASPQSITINGVARYFHVLINANSRTAEEVYEYVQYALRQNSDIDSGAGTKNGLLTNPLVYFVGNDLYTYQDSTGGVAITSFLSADTNRIHFTDDSGVVRSYPYVAALNLNFGANLVADSAAKYWVFFTTNYGTSSALLVQDATPANMTGNVSGASSVSLTFDYDNNVQGGRTAGTDAAVTAIAIGGATAQYVLATGTITRSTTNTISLVANLERNY